MPKAALLLHAEFEGITHLIPHAEEYEWKIKVLLSQCFASYKLKQEHLRRDV